MTATHVPRRAKLYASHSLVKARLVEGRLRELGVPVFFRSGRDGLSWLVPGGPYELWVEDESVLQRPDVQEALQSARGDGGFTPEEEDAISRMPFHDEPTEIGLAWVLILFLAAMGLTALLILVALPWLWQRVTGP